MRALEPASFELRVQARPESARLLRERLSLWLEGVGATPDDVFGIVLAATEAFVNAVEHPHEPRAGVIEIEGALADHTVTVTVRDYGSWRDERQREEGGYGFPLMRELMDAVDVQPWSEGTAITLQRHLTPR